MGDVADRIHGHPHAIPGPPECSVAFGAPCPAGLALVLQWGAGLLWTGDLQYLLKMDDTIC